MALLSELGESVPATSINRWWALSMQAIISAGDAIAAGNRDCVIAGGVDPTVMGIGPVPATRGLLDRAGTSIDDYGLAEINEAFASQCEYARRELGIDEERYNVNGGAIAIGHPLGASGSRLPVTLLHEMEKRDADRGLAALCVGFGRGAAIEFSR
jgi:acetyl-CoA acyltransferase